MGSIAEARVRAHDTYATCPPERPQPTNSHLTGLAQFRTLTKTGNMKARMTQPLSAFQRRQAGQKAYEHIFEHGLYNSTTPAPKGTLRGIDVLPHEVVRQKINRTVKIYYGHRDELPDLTAPQTFFEKLAIAKFFAPIPMPSPADKLNVQSFIPDDLTSEIATIEVVWSGDQPITAALIEQLDLPAGTYFAKSSGGTGRNIRFTVPLEAKQAARIETLSTGWLVDKHGERAGEWWYNLMRSRNFIERDLTPESGSLTDWKFHCGGGEVLAVQVDLDRHSQHRQTMYDADFRHIPEEMFFEYGPPETAPPFFDSMRNIARRIAAEFEFVRVDMYHANDRLYLGELTLAPMGGLRLPRSPHLDAHMGAAWVSDFMGTHAP